MSTVDRMKYLTTVYSEPEISHVLNMVSSDAVTVMANEMRTMRIQDQAKDTDEEAIKIMTTVIDELADRIKAEVRYRINLGKEKKWEKQKK